MAEGEDGSSINDRHGSDFPAGRWDLNSRAHANKSQVLSFSVWIAAG